MNTQALLVHDPLDDLDSAKQCTHLDTSPASDLTLAGCHWPEAGARIQEHETSEGFVSWLFELAVPVLWLWPRCCRPPEALHQGGVR